MSSFRHPETTVDGDATAVTVDTCILVVVTDSGIRNVELSPGRSLCVGRGADADVSIDNASVSRAHARFHGGAAPEVEDLGSRNGTTVLGRRIPPRQRCRLRHDAVVGVGNASIFVRTPSSTVGPDVMEGIAPSSGSPGPRAAVASEHAGMRELYERVDVVAQSSIPVLIHGETGSGKELVAERVHAASPRANEPLLRVNCAALAEGVLASELFGHERGSFTGAHTSRVGVFEAADGGSLFLDEVGELAPAIQAKLLRVLESGEVTRVGTHRARHVDVRVISATNRDLPAAVAKGLFRSDLYYRLNGVTLTVPPLREHLDDIVPLAEHFAREFAEPLNAPAPTLSEEVKAALRTYSWPGNVRELKNVIRCAVLMGGGDVLDERALVQELEQRERPDGPAPPLGSKATPAIRLRVEMARTEREAIVDALRRARTQREAAESLGISRRALINKLDTHRIPRPRKRQPETE
jgi:DNA-binding NtrC family response regulator